MSHHRACCCVEGGGPEEGECPVLADCLAQCPSTYTVTVSDIVFDAYLGCVTLADHIELVTASPSTVITQDAGFCTWSTVVPDDAPTVTLRVDGADSDYLMVAFLNCQINQQDGCTDPFPMCIPDPWGITGILGVLVSIWRLRVAFVQNNPPVYSTFREFSAGSLVTLGDVCPLAGDYMACQRHDGIDTTFQYEVTAGTVALS